MANRLDQFRSYRERMNQRIADLKHLGVNCIDYHILQCIEAGWSDEELVDALNVGLVVGGSIVIPHLRHAVETLDLVRAEQQQDEDRSS